MQVLIGTTILFIEDADLVSDAQAKSSYSAFQEVPVPFLEA